MKKTLLLLAQALMGSLTGLAMLTATCALMDCSLTQAMYAGIIAVILFIPTIIIFKVEY